MTPLTHAEFERKRAEAAGAEKLRGRALALVAVPLGIAQFLFIHWAGTHARPGARVPLAISLWTAYVALLAFLLWRMTRAIDNARPKCPRCRRPFNDASARAASRTGRCDRCDGEIFTA